MSEIPTLSQYDSRRAKVRCSLQWVIVQAYSKSHIPKQLSPSDVECVFESDGGLKRSIALLLCSAEPYCQIVKDLFDINDRLQSHEEVIQILCRKGMYVLDDTDFIVTAQDLRKMPLDLTSHLAIIDMLMLSTVSCKYAPINSIIYTVRKVSSFSSSKELPVNLEEAFLLWMNKLSLRVQEIRRNALESDKHTFGQPREDNCDFPAMENTTDDLCDGRGVGLLLHYYCPDSFPLQDISLKDPCSLADSWHNLHLSLGFCNDVILPPLSSSFQDSVPPAVLHPVDFLYCSQDLKMNILAFLGNLYHNLEMDALVDVVNPLGHAVICKRNKVERVPSTEDDTSSSEMTFQKQLKSPISFQTHQHRTMDQVNQIIPGVQPLISSATKRSFVGANHLESASITSNSEHAGSPVPFSSKPLLVRRNKDVHTNQPSSTSKNYSHTRPQAAHFPSLGGRDHMSETDSQTSTDYISGLHQMRSYPYHGIENGVVPSASENSNDPVPFVNKWHIRTPVTDIRNTNSNNAIDVMSGGRPNTRRMLPNQSHHLVGRHSKNDETSSLTSGTSTLLSNVNMGSDEESEEFCIPTHPNGYITQPEYLPTAVNLNWNGFQHVDQGSDTRLANLMRNDMLLETARTSDNSPRSGTDGSSLTSGSTTDLTSVTSRTTNSQIISSNEATGSSEGPETYLHQPPLAGDYPNIIRDNNSPDKPNTLRSNMIDSSALHSYNLAESSNFNPTSQKSYTVHSGAFRTVDSARAAGYPIITNSPDRHLHPTPAEHGPSYTEDLRASSSNRKSRMSSFAENGSGDSPSLVSNGNHTPDEGSNQVTVGGSVVRLRNPQQKRDRAVRAAKTTSWMEIAQKQNKLEQPEENRRRHSNHLTRDKIAQLRLQLEERRRDIEKEKRLKEREWAKELLKIRKEMYSFTQLSQDMKNGQHQPVLSGKSNRPLKATISTSQHIKGHVTLNKNEETSSDYSSKSPSPSSVYNNDRTEAEQATPQQFSSQKMTPAEMISHTSQQESKDYFASPLSTTTYLINGVDKSNTNMDQSYQKTAPSNTSAAKTYVVQEEQQRNVDYSRSFGQNEKTYNVSQQNQLDHHDPSHKHPVQTSNNHLGPGTINAPSGSFDRTLTSSKHPSSMEKMRSPPVDSKILKAGQSNVVQDARGMLSHDQDAVENPTPNQRMQKRVSPPMVQVVQASPAPEVRTRRSLFPGGNEDPDVSAEQENIDPNNLTIGQPTLGTYDSFCRLSAGSNHSTPAKTSPLHNIEEVSPPKAENEPEVDMTSVLHKTADIDRKGGKGFELVDEGTPNTELAKKKELFLLKQLKKEEELKRKKAERENETEKRKEDARVKQEEVAIKKEEERQKRQQRLEEYKRRKIQEEEAQLVQQSSGIIAGGSGKKHPPSSKSDTALNSARSTKVSRSGRSSPSTDVSSASKNKYLSDSPQGTRAAEKYKTFNVAGNEQGEGTSTLRLRTRKLSAGGRKDWDADSASSAVSSEYSGPKLYKQPSSKSNRNLIYNAICHCCLPAKVNEALRNKTIEILEMSDARHLMVLFRDAKCQFRALYSYDPEQEKLHKITGNGPASIVPNMIDRLFKYNSGRKAFLPLPSKTLSVSIDAITIKNTLWQTSKKPAHPSSAKK